MQTFCPELLQLVVQAVAPATGINPARIATSAGTRINRARMWSPILSSGKVGRSARRARAAAATNAPLSSSPPSATGPSQPHLAGRVAAMTEESLQGLQRYAP